MTKQKFIAILLVLLTIPCIIWENDGTATAFMLLLAIPMFFSKNKFIF